MSATKAESRPGRTITAAIALFSAFLLMFAATILYMVVQARQEAQHRALERASADSQVVATNVRWVSELARQALRRIDEAMGPSVSARQGAVRDIREAVDNLPGPAKAYVVDAAGRTLFSTDVQDTSAIDITDREYFAVPASGAEWYTSSLLISRVDGGQIFVFSRRLERDGAFAGVAILSFDVRLLEEIWASLELDRGSSVGIVRTDGMLVARFPLVAEPLDLSRHVLFTEHLKNAAVGTYRSAASPADGVERFVGYRRVEGTDFIAIASISAASAYRNFWRATVSTLLIGLPALLGLAAASLWITRLLQRDARRRSELADALEINRLLFRDTHHRVKNNLQSIQSLVRMQAIPDQAKRDLQSRIGAMTAVHEHIYRLDRYSEVAAGEFVPALVEPLREAYGADVAISYDIADITVDRDQATPLALLVNEVVTNALKYAFPDPCHGTLTIKLEPVDAERTRLTIRDDGIGFDPDAGDGGMGRRLVRAMVLQLNGEFAYARDEGTVFTATLRLHAHPSVEPSRRRFATVTPPSEPA